MTAGGQARAGMGRLTEAELTGSPQLARVLAVAPYANPHVTSIYDALAAEPGLEVVRASACALPPERVALGWPEMPADAPYLQPWRRPGDGVALVRELARSDVALLPGPFHFRWLPAAHAFRLWRGSGPLVAWSEPFLAFRERSALNRLALACVARALDSPRVHLLSIGRGAIDDYRALGVRHWSARSFAFAVEPAPAATRGRADEGTPAREPGPLRLLFAGELIERKRVDLLVEALARPGLACLPWQLAIAGAGPERGALEALVARHGLGERVAFLGPLDRPSLLERLPRFDAVVLPSRFDGWGAIVNEALEAGRACVVSDACGSATLLASGQGGFTFRSGDAESLARALRPLAEDPSLAARLGASGREAVAAHRPERLASRLAAFCRALAGHEPLPRFDDGPLSELR